MKRPEYQYDQPFVPEHLTKLTVEKLPLEKPFFVSPGERDGYNDETAIFVAPDRRLMMSRSYSIDPDDARVSSPIGRVGISRVVLMNSETMTPRQVYIADLRFIEDHQLVDSDDMNDEMTDQEEFMESLAALDDSVPFDAFIATEQGDKIDIDKPLPKGTFYGNPSLYPALKKLRKKGNKVMRQFILDQDNQTSPGANPSPEQPSTNQTAPVEEESGHQTADVDDKLLDMQD